MARIIRTSTRARGRRTWWSSVIAGAALGGVAAWMVMRALRGGGAAEPVERPRSRGAPREPDLEACAARLRGLPGTEELSVRSLGGGILELVGSAEAGLDVASLLHALASEPYVTVVVNRVWTPDYPDGAPSPPPASDLTDPSSASSAP